MPVRILHILGDSKFGGASFGILRLARFWKSLGWEVEILATDRVFVDTARNEGVRTVELDVIWRAIRPVRDLLGLLRLWRFLRAQPYTVVHTHTTKAGFIGRIAARLAGVPIVLHTAHGFAFHEASTRRKIAFYTILERVASWCCDRVITVSYFHAEWGARLGIAPRRKLHPIPNGIPDLPRQSPAAREQLRESLGVTPAQFVVFTPGRLAPEKGIEDLLDATVQLRELWGSRLVVWIAGDGALREPLQRMAAERSLSAQVRFLGFRSDVAELLHASDLVVLPTYREGLSIALLEAMAAGKPIVTTNISPNVEATQSGKAALLVTPGIPQELAVAISRMVSEHPFRCEKSAAARQVFENTYTQRAMLDGYHRLYLEHLQRLLPLSHYPAVELSSAAVASPAEMETLDSICCRDEQKEPETKEFERAQPVSCLQPSSDR